MSLPFYLVYAALKSISERTGLTYEMINVILYFVLIPTVYLALIDKILRRPITLVIFYTCLAFLLLMFRDWNELAEAVFNYAVEFLLLFSAVGLNYDRASVAMCIIVPLLIFLVLLYYAFPEFFRRHLPSFARAFSRLGPQPLSSVGERPRQRR